MAKLPQIRFNGFIANWSEKMFSETYLVASEGGTPSTGISKYYEGGTIPFVKIEDTENKYIYRAFSHITEEGLNNSSAWLIPENNIIFTNGATVGNVAINKVPVATKQGILGVVADRSKFDLEYLFYALSDDRFQKEVERRQSKGTFATIILGNLNKISLPYTDIEEQVKVGTFLKALDELIDSKQEKLDNLRQQKSALLEQMFPCDGEDVPKIRFKGFDKPWQCKEFRSVISYPSVRVDNKNLTTHNYIATENMRQKFMGVFDAEYVPQNYASIEYHKDDILMANIRPYLKKIWLSDRDGGCSPDVMVFRVSEEAVPAFMYYSLANDKFIDYVMDGAQGVKMPRGNKELISIYKLYMPSHEEQQKISDFFCEIDKVIENSAKQITTLKRLKHTLVQKMLAE